MASEPKIPEITDAAIANALETVRPIVMLGGLLWNIELPDPRRVAFTWSPTITSRATGLRYIRTIRTLHRFGAPVFFKPSIAEVLAQLPADHGAACFLVEGPGTADDLNRESDALHAGFHVARTLLFAREGGTDD